VSSGHRLPYARASARELIAPTTAAHRQVAHRQVAHRQVAHRQVAHRQALAAMRSLAGG
jgi:hypothetical protein